jgi:hypothetical protein
MHDRVIKGFLILLVALCCVMSFLFLKPRDMVANKAVYSDDYSLHYSNALAARTFWSGWGRCWGYDPHLLGGFPRCALVNADNKAWELVVLIMGPVVGTGRAYNAYLIAFLFFFPLLVYAAARNFALARPQAAGAALLSFLFFYLSVPKDFVLWGMVAYIVSCFLSIYVLSLLYRLMTVPFGFGLYCFTALCASILFLNHILSPVHIFVPAALLCLMYAGQKTWQQNLLLIALPFIVITVNLFWLIPVLDFFIYKTDNPAHYEFTLQIKNIFEPLHVYGHQRRSLALSAPVLNNTFIEVMLLLFGTTGCYLWWKSRQRRLSAVFGAGIVVVFLVTYYGSHMPFFAQFQPQRFANALNVLLLIPAAVGLTLCLSAVWQGRSRFERLLVCAVAFVLLYQPVVRPFLTLVRNDHLYRLSCTMPQSITQLMAFLAAKTTREGRILIEDSESINVPGHFEPEAYYSTHLPGLFPELLKREYLCGPRPMYPIKHSYASFTRGVLFDRPIADYTLDDLRAAFDLFNVKWIVCWFDESLYYFDTLPGYVRRIGAIDKFIVYEVLREPSFFLKGSGRVEADYNRLKLSQVQPDDGEIIIAYHWMKHLVSDCGADVERVMLGGDPVGFIKITNPPQSLTVYNGY